MSFRLIEYLVHIKVVYIMEKCFVRKLSKFCLLFSIFRGVQRKWSDLPRVQSIIGLMTSSFIIPVLVLSLFPHQEARFLIPVTLPIIFLHSQRIRHISGIEQKCNKNGTIFKGKFSQGSRGSLLLTLWYFINIILTIFFGFLHQGGMYALSTHLAGELQVKSQLTTLHLVTSHTYSLPLFFLQLRNSKRSLFSRQTGRRYRLARQFYSYEMGSAPLEDVHMKLQTLLEVCELKKHEKRLDYLLYLALPASLVDQFHVTTPNSTLAFEYSVEKVFYPHVSTEALPDVFHLLSHECMNYDTQTYCETENIYTSPLKFLSRFMQQFGLTLIRIQR